MLLLIAGLIALVAGAEALVRGASKLAISLGVSPLVVGLTVVAFGTSAPEAAVSIGAVAGGTTDLAIGNVIGSNIFNILMILGLSALVKPLVVHAQIVRQELPVMVGASILLALFVLDGRLQVAESAVLLSGVVAYTIFLVRQSRSATRKTQAEFAEVVEEPKSSWDRHWSVQLLLIAAGLALLVFGSDLLVTAAVTIAKSLGVSDLVIGLTIIAAGTSLPEVATSILAAMRGQRDIAVGNVIGSNTFNLLLCLGAAGIASPDGLGVTAQVLSLDLWVMLGVAALTIPLFIPGYVVTRANALLLVSAYVAYTAYMVLAAQAHPSAAPLGEALIRYALPAMVILFILMMVRPHRQTHHP
ncbi:MAG TPA: calcium/sodium antiporter [Myxococcota bacterium]|nr:calcium/sodium antiporter [Myxococcota bacterium]